ncbi:MAG: hypothetical protein AAF357_13690 [Verrucomicrobiota bacterium]
MQDSSDMGMLDAAKSEALRRGLNALLQKHYGEINALTLNTEERSLDFTILLHGETEPVDVRLGQYDIIEEAENSWILCRNWHISREWMHRLVQSRAEGKRIRLPPELSKVVQFLL